MLIGEDQGGLHVEPSDLLDRDEAEFNMLSGEDQGGLHVEPSDLQDRDEAEPNMLRGEDQGEDQGEDGTRIGKKIYSDRYLLSMVKKAIEMEKKYSDLKVFGSLVLDVLQCIVQDKVNLGKIKKILIFRPYFPFFLLQ